MKSEWHAWKHEKILEHIDKPGVQYPKLALQSMPLKITGMTAMLQAGRHESDSDSGSVPTFLSIELFSLFVHCSAEHGDGPIEVHLKVKWFA